MERRYEQRLPLRIAVRVSDRRGNVSYCSTRDVARSGAFIETRPGALEPSQVVWLALPDPESSAGWADVAAVVVHHRPDGVGVMFSHPVPVLAGLARRRPEARRAQAL
jgi:hypothetical protein